MKVYEDARTEFIEAYKEKSVNELRDLLDRAREAHRKEGPTHRAVARCEVLYELIQARGEE